MLGFAYYGWAKGATAYEWQCGRLCVRITHLRGDYWRWKPWRRVSIKVVAADEA